MAIRADFKSFKNKNNLYINAAPASICLQVGLIGWLYIVAQLKKLTYYVLIHCYVHDTDIKI